jgi:uncharacterized cupredoxin-like copper-binding protein
MKPNFLLLGAVVVAVGLAVTGCGGSSNSQSQASSTSGNASPSGSSKTIKVAESEYKLTPSSVSLPAAGTYTFKVANKGSVTHALEIEGTGMHEESGELQPGQTKTFTVDFKGPGTYEMYCPVDGHRDKGMDGKVTIGSAAAGPAGTTNDTSTTETETHTDTSGGGGGRY